MGHDPLALSENATELTVLASIYGRKLIDVVDLQQRNAHRTVEPFLGRDADRIDSRNDNREEQNANVKAGG